MFKPTLKIQFDRIGFVAGQILSGRVEVSYSHPLSISAFDLFLVGSEEIPEKNFPQLHTDLSLSLLDQRSTLSVLDENKTIRKGRSFFPFAIKIPPTSPSSLDNLKNKIIYRLTCRLKSTKDSYEVSRIVEIFESLTEEERTKLEKPASFFLENGTLDKGQVSIKINTKKLLYKSGDLVSLLLQVQNGSELRIDEVAAVLVGNRVVNLKAKNGVPDIRKKEKIMATKHFTEPEVFVYPHENRQFEIYFSLPDVHRITKSPRLEISFKLKLFFYAKGKYVVIVLPIEILPPLSVDPPPSSWFSDEETTTRRATHHEADEAALEDEKRDEQTEKKLNIEEDPLGDDDDLQIPQKKIAMLSNFVLKMEATAVSDFKSPDGSFSFKKGDKILLHSWNGDVWEGTNKANGHRGEFDKTLVSMQS